MHRYASHGAFTMSPFWERFFYIFAYFTMGSSYLSPRAYAILHRMHHAYSDTEKDPHSPHFFRDVFQMMWATKVIFQEYVKFNKEPETRFKGNYPEWRTVDLMASSMVSRIGFVLFYIAFYAVFAEHWWMFLLLPIHFVMGPLHGALVNWCGHKYGYSNFDNGDHSKNTTPFDFFMLG